MNHIAVPGMTLPAVTSHPAPGYGRNLLWAGLLLLVAGMCVLPAGPSFNPGRPFQYLLAVSLYLPALIIGFAYPRRWLEFAKRPLMPVLLALFGWAILSLAWSNARRPADEFMRLLSVLLFLFAVVQGLGNDLRRQRGLLLSGAAVLTATAVAAMVQFAFHATHDDRLTGFGVMANANLIGAAMGAGILWLWPWRFETRGQRLIKWLAMAVMATCLLLTYSRSAWVALFTAVFVLLAVRRRERAWQRLVLLLAVALGVAIAAYPELTERGLSFRPQIFEYAIGLIAQHPWLGWGLGASFTIPVEAGTGMFQVHTHNLFTQITVELGLPGLLLWLAVWLGLGWRAWHFRQEPIGRVILGLWLFASVMVQFDLPHLIDSPRPGWLILWLPLALSLLLPSVVTKRSSAS
ncbi:O-antigen ligase family protein [Stenotrophomonas humi]